MSERTREQEKLIMKWVEKSEIKKSFRDYCEEHSIPIEESEIQDFEEFKPYYIKVFNKKQKTKNQHFVPQFYLKNFTNTDWRIETAETQNYKILRPQVPKKICSWDYYYCFFEWKKDIMWEMLEDFFWYYEQNFQQIYDELIEKIKLTAPVSDELLYKLSEFISVSWLRGDKMRKQIKDMEKQMLTWTMKTTYNMKKSKGVLEEELDTEEMSGFVNSDDFEVTDTSNKGHIDFLTPDNINQFAIMLYSKRIRFYITEWEKKFVTSDNCVIELIPLKHIENPLWNHFMERLHYFVLSPEILVEFSCPIWKWKRVKRKRIKDEETLYYNFLRWRYSKYIYSNSQENFIKSHYKDMMLNNCEKLSVFLPEFQKIDCNEIRRHHSRLSNFLDKM